MWIAELPETTSELAKIVPKKEPLVSFAAAQGARAKATALATPISTTATQRPSLGVRNSTSAPQAPPDVPPRDR